MVTALANAPPSPLAWPEIRFPLVPAVSLLSNGAPVSGRTAAPVISLRYIRFIALALAFFPHFPQANLRAQVLPDLSVVQSFTNLYYH
ncbi:uncharacterized protein CC84DRAFT_770821 [Paraphaeosphaeria sporulosa]|uniref:Uncharacterized protein n=1 Tax=Paraphaeosphaeria sporulosa TaxID=1460663 RepID=A0A177CI74_9PLEO|nr:uncharacterized protein CC84DRAFT_770821 [Paraphaeosphaeria sporulosa]OAG06487.1 hypothetical protein CC84DRAFT_770821 [Paraphaeosphaeria sporulosa]